MKVVAIETSGKIGSVALADDGALLAERSFEKGMVHGRELIPCLQALFERVGWPPDGVDLIAVSQGPGSYTGLRVGITCAKSLAWTLGKDLLAVPSLDVIAENLRDQDGLVGTALDAKRGQVYACTYRAQGGVVHRLSDYRVLLPEELADELEPGSRVIGDAVARFGEIFRQAGLILGDEAQGQARARHLVRLAEQRYAAGARSDWRTVTPMYLRRPEAEEKWEQRMQDRGSGPKSI